MPLQKLQQDLLLCFFLVMSTAETSLQAGSLRGKSLWIEKWLWKGERTDSVSLFYTARIVTDTIPFVS